MEQSDLEAELKFAQPYQQIVAMLVVLGLTAALTVLAAPRVLPVFEANPYLNGFIFFVFLVGVLACFWQVAQLVTSIRWIEAFVLTPDHEAQRPPRLLAPLASLLRSREARMQIAASSTRSILDSVATRIDEAREITRYIVNLLIFLGLLGTFYGLATTVPALVDTIRGLAPAEGEAGVDVFARLMTGLDSQLSGMGVAFASSLLGLAGSLVVGLLELFASHGQNRFYRELEEWLSSFTRLSFAGADGDGQSDVGLVALAMEHMSEQIDKLQMVFAESDSAREVLDNKISQLADAVERMAERIEASAPSDSALMRVADGQDRLVEVLESKEASDGLDAESRMRLRSIDVQMLRILEEIAAGRQESMAELRTDLSAIARALAPHRPPRKDG